MPDRTKNDQTRNGMQCHEFDALLTDAIDGVLTGAALDRFQAHAAGCKACGPLLADAEAGRNWLKDLTEVEPPASLVRSILASTTGVDTQRLRVPESGAATRATQPQISWLDRVQASVLEPFFVSVWAPIWTTVRQPRFAMSFGMAFFVLSVGLTVAGVKPADLRQVSLRPSAIRHTYFATQAHIVHYYENIRIVYEVESRVRELRRAEPAEPGLRDNAPSKSKGSKNDTPQQPEQKEERNYSQNDNSVILACVPQGPSVIDLSNLDRSNLDPSNPDLPVVSVTTYRRFV